MSQSEPPAPLPCPWCGDEKVHVHGDIISGHSVVCTLEACGATGPHRDTESEAVREWNLNAPRGRVAAESSVTREELARPVFAAVMDYGTRKNWRGMDEEELWNVIEASVRLLARDAGPKEGVGA